MFSSATRTMYPALATASPTRIPWIRASACDARSSACAATNRSLRRCLRRKHSLSTGQCSGTSPDASPSRRLDGRNRRAHHAVLLALGSVVAEAALLVEAARGVVEELGPHRLALLEIVRIALDHAAARLRDQVDGTAKRHPCDSFSPIVPVDEDARDPIVGQFVAAGRLVFLAVMDVR